MSDFGFDEEQEKRARERQLLLLGALLGCKELRARISGQEFADAKLGAAAADVVNPEPTRLSLRCVLNDIGLGEWQEGDGSPLELLIEHVRLDARLALIWRDMAYAIGKTNAVRAMSAREKYGALRKVGKVIDEAHRLHEAAKEAAQTKNRTAEPNTPPGNGTGPQKG